VSSAFSFHVRVCLLWFIDRPTHLNHNLTTGLIFGDRLRE
jgi:hypothetical protein